MVLGMMHGRMVGEMDHAHTGELEEVQKAVEQEGMDQVLSKRAAGDDQSEAVPDRAEAGGAGAAIGEAADILSTKDLGVVLEEDSTWMKGMQMLQRE